jgi:hypothetical protein
LSTEREQSRFCGQPIFQRRLKHRDSERLSTMLTLSTKRGQLKFVDRPLADPFDLLATALQRLQGYGLAAEIERREVQLRKTKADALVRIGYGGREATYAVELKRGLRPNGLGAVIHQIERLGEPGLLVADHVTPPMADELRARRVPFIDAAGNAFLDQPPLFVWVKGQKPLADMGAAKPAAGRVPGERPASAVRADLPSGVGRSALSRARAARRRSTRDRGLGHDGTAEARLRDRDARQAKTAAA